ncbi:hypothetical protein M2459_002723 [Parabacteroides sp. PF5-5]|uniref:DUF2971 domain-containing protein n=1 Tax=unclassified Parabacteroides TaxID=2649774 RepID=UPI00247729F3|nr:MULTISPECIES: DUF2971 domain-containing protein [unclassified Parabacteroides]MDH6305936.1 hypothetical protein [Parabacteroides sp. PH5-39]MDH6316849.1 hypothetical protein [Parabacteroides sp. PF5-13]MDH6320648.1 hypothetical protein [Parabacteroides sp. PH5-13]MDH6324431.1 hypothetical protein [Parabacteroides sp. PH5-8]MDH6328034.1 hypothetical protein [Parabacteroides sp. PH5-41]
MIRAQLQKEEKGVLDCIEQGFVPEFLYKYMNLKTLCDFVLENNTLQFQSPISYNDPYECVANIDINFTYEEALYYLSYCESTGFIPPNIKEFIAFKTSVSLQEKELYFKKMLVDVWEKSSICCFSEINDEILMWSHYANEHKGVCLKFSLKDDLKFFSMPHRVKYALELPVVNMIRNPQSIIVPIFTKYEKWSYEAECRVFKQNENKGKEYNTFNKSALREIIFGCRVEDFSIKMIKEKVKKQNFPNVSFKKCQVNDKEYKLNIFEV